MQTEKSAEGAPDSDDEPDEIDQRIDGWREILVDLDPTTEGIVQRIEILAKRLKRSMVETLAEHGLKHEEWSVIAILRKAGEPYRVSAGQVAQRAEISSGAMTNRLDRLEKAGLVQRLPDPSDRRGVLVELTPKGYDAWMGTVHVQGGKEQLITAVLDDAEREQLHRLLRWLTRSAPSGC
jgi:DNA-binding MarR family transcriptional regulator